MQTTFDTPDPSRILEINCRWEGCKVVFEALNFGSANVFPIRADCVRVDFALTFSAFIFTKRPEFDSKVKS